MCRQNINQNSKSYKTPHIWLSWASYALCAVLIFLTHWGRNKMADICQTTFSNAFPWMKMYEFRLKCHWSLFVRIQLAIYHHWLRWWLGADQATSHYLERWWLDCRRIYASLGLNELKVGRVITAPHCSCELTAKEWVWWHSEQRDICVLAAKNC